MENCNSKAELSFNTESLVQVDADIQKNETIKQFSCKNCGKGFSTKQRMEYHIYNKKIKCNEKKKREVIQCYYCNKIFSRADSLKRHLDICFYFSEGQTKDEMIKEFTKEASEIKKQRRKLRDAIRKVQPEIYMGISKKTNDNEDNDSNENDNIDSHINNEVKYIPFGKEQHILCKKSFVLKCIRNPEQGILDLIQLYHFNEMYPQYQTVILKNKRESFLYVYNGDFWECCDKRDTMLNLIATKKDILDDWYEQVSSDTILSVINQRNFEKFSEKLDTILNINLNQIDISSNKKIDIHMKKKLDKMTNQIFIMILNQSNENEVKKI